MLSEMQKIEIWLVKFQRKAKTPSGPFFLYNFELIIYSSDQMELRNQLL